MKKLALTLLMTVLTTGVMCTSVFAATTVTFNGGDIVYKGEEKYGTIKLDLTNIDSQVNVIMDTTELMTYLDDDGTVDKIIYTDEVGKGYSINSIVAEMNAKGGVPVYTASSMPSITAETPMTAFMSFWKGDDAAKVAFAPKFYSLNDYLYNDSKANVYTTKPESDWLYAPGTAENITKAGKYLFVVHDNGAIDCSPLSILCVNVGETAIATTAPTTTPTTTTYPTTTPTTYPTTAPPTATKVPGWSRDAKIWDGSLYIMKVGFKGLFQGKVLKEIPNYPLGGLVTSTYGYNAADMYSDGKCTKPWNFATDTVDSYSHIIYVKLPTFSVTFDSQGGTAVDSVEVTPGTGDFGKVPVPATPTKDGYTFVGWVVANPRNSVLWKFDTHVVSYDVTFYAKWTKN